MKTIVTGSNGQLGKTIKSIVQDSSAFIFTDINNLDITKKKEIEFYVKTNKIDCIVNCAAYTNVDSAEIEKEKANKLNCNAVKNLVEIAENFQLRLIHISTDYVYNGVDKSVISEYEHVNPQNYYGISKLKCEKILISCAKKYNFSLINLRIPNVFGKWCKPNYNSVIATFCNNIARRKKIKILDPNKIIKLV